MANWSERGLKARSRRTWSYWKYEILEASYNLLCLIYGLSRLGVWCVIGGLVWSVLVGIAVYLTALGWSAPVFHVSETQELVLAGSLALVLRTTLGGPLLRMGKWLYGAGYTFRGHRANCLDPVNRPGNDGVESNDGMAQR